MGGRASADRRAEARAVGCRLDATGPLPDIAAQNALRDGCDVRSAIAAIAKSMMSHPACAISSACAHHAAVRLAVWPAHVVPVLQHALLCCNVLDAAPPARAILPRAAAGADAQTRPCAAAHCGAPSRACTRRSRACGSAVARLARPVQHSAAILAYSGAAKAAAATGAG
jgi:hypothetical protein